MNFKFEGIDIAKFGGTTHNKWLINDWDMNKELVWNVSDPNAQAHILYLSFPSLKNPNHDPGESLIHTGECVTFVPWQTFEKWEKSEFHKRPEDYEKLKRSMEERMMTQITKEMPELMKHCTHYELSTPLTAKHFVGAIAGNIYGMEATPARYKNLHLRAKTPLKNFYLSGVDVLSTGIGGAMASGLITAATIDKRIIPRLL